LQKLHVQGNIQASGSTSAGTQFLGLSVDAVATPSFSWTGDLNTGMYHPGADKLGLVTAGVERVIVLDNGNVGIGITNPGVALEVANGRFGTAAILRLNSPVSNGEVSKIEFKYWDDTTSKAEIRGGRTGLNGGYLNFNTADAANAISIRMVIDSSGNVGIGITNPSHKLYVAGDARIQGNLTVNGTTTTVNTTSTTTSQTIITNTGTATALIVNQTGTQPSVDIQDGGVSVLRIVDGGAVGLGYTTPVKKLSVGCDINDGIQVGATSDYNFGIRILRGTGDGASTTVYNAAIESWHGIAFKTNLTGLVDNVTHVFDVRTGRTYIKGNVGIGTENPLGKLEVNVVPVLVGGDPTYVGDIRLISQGGGSILNAPGGIEFKVSNAGSGYGWRINAPDATGTGDGVPFSIQSRMSSASWTNNFIIKNNGNVGIGTTNPLEKLHVEGNILLNNDISSSYASTLYGSTTAYATPVSLKIGYKALTVINSNGNVYASAADIQIKAQGLSWSVAESSEPKGGEIYIEGGRSALGSSGSGSSGSVIIRTHGTSRTTGFDRLTVTGNGTIILNAYGAGTLSTNSSGVISVSDGRYKSKTRALLNGIEQVMLLEPTYYKWNADSPWSSEYEELGFVAQEVAIVIPEASPEPEQADKFRNYHDRAILAVAIKAIQELKVEIESLKAQLAQAISKNV
jgi:hypothetical protein